jgi:hypothetical protein
MAMHQQVRGVGPRGGIFWAGRPTTMLALDDSVVFLQAGTLASILGAQGAIGAIVQGVSQNQQAKARAAAGDEMTGAQFEGTKRARVIPYGSITAARLEGSGRSRKLVLETNGSQTHLRYPAKLWPDDDATAFLGGQLGDRFTRSAG